MELETGSVFAGHRIDGRAGKGGMGVVYRATDLQLDRRVALKLVSPELAADPSFAERFKRESRLAASLDHPNVIPIYHAGEEDGRLFVTMRIVEGTDLAEMLRRDRRLAPDRAVAILGQVAAALDAAHARGLVHRDVKPANILLQDDHVFLTDFGLSKQAGSGEDLTETGAVLGTVDYMAPEQVQGGIVDARSDVYALGCVLFQMLTGRVPFERPNGVAKLFAHVSDPAPRVTGVPDGLADAVGRALEKDPGRRFQSAGELAQAAAEAVGVSLAPAAAPPSIRSPGLARRGRARIWIPVAAIAAAAVVAALVIGAGGGGSGAGGGGSGAGGGGSGGSPADRRAIAAVMEQLQQGFSETVCRDYFTEHLRSRYFAPNSGQKAFNQCVNLGGGPPNRKPLVVKDVTIQGNTASARVASADLPPTIYLVKQNGRWRADDFREDADARYSRKVAVAIQPTFRITPALDRFVTARLPLADAGSLPQKAVTFLRSSVARITALQPPAHVKDIHARLVAAMRRQLAGAEDALAAQKTHDAKAFEQGEKKVFKAVQALGSALDDLSRAQ